MENEGIQQEQPQGVDYEKLASILDGRQAATEDKVLKGYFREQGMSGDEMAQAIEAFKSQRASQQPDIAGMQESIAQLQQEIEKATKAANRAKVENAVIIEATKMGIDPKAIPYLTRMADLTNVGDDLNVVNVCEADSTAKFVLECSDGRFLPGLEHGCLGALSSYPD